MAAVTATPEPVQGCSVEPLGSLRYRAVASPGYVRRWWPDGPELVAGSQAPVVDFDRKDDLQAGFFRTLTGADLAAPRHYVPSSGEFAQAIRLGLGWGLLPEQQCLADLRKRGPRGAGAREPGGCRRCTGNAGRSTPRCSTS